MYKSGRRSINPPLNKKVGDYLCELGTKRGAGGEGYKGFETQKELLDESVWNQALRPDPEFYA